MLEPVLMVLSPFTFKGLSRDVTIEEGFCEAIAADAVPDNKAIALSLNGQDILVCRFNHQYYALRNQCTHQDTPLADGRIRGGFISCPLHGVRFDLATGEPKGALTSTPVDTFETRESDGMVFVRI